MGFNQTHPGTDSRDVSVHPMTKRPPNQGGLFYWMAVRLILVPPIIVRVVVGAGIPMVFWQGGAEYFWLNVVGYGKGF